jgi:hypothetical protein
MISYLVATTAFAQGVLMGTAATAAALFACHQRGKR